MGVSIEAVGFKPADEKWHKMKLIWETCEESDVVVPSEVLTFFNHEAPEDKPGMEVDLGDSCKEYEHEYREGYEIDVTKLPKGVRFIRVYNSY